MFKGFFSFSVCFFLFVLFVLFVLSVRVIDPVSYPSQTCSRSGVDGWNVGETSLFSSRPAISRGITVGTLRVILFSFCKYSFAFLPVLKKNVDFDIKHSLYVLVL